MNSQIDDCEAWFFRMKEKYPVMLSKLEYVETPVGWNKLLENMFESIKRFEFLLQLNKNWIFITENELDKYPSEQNIYSFVQFVQIKSKFGMLRAYYTSLSPEKTEGVDNIIHIAEDISRTTCVICSSPRKENMRGRCENCKKYNDII